METTSEQRRARVLDVNVAKALLMMGHVGPPGVWHMEECWAALQANERQPCLGRCSDTRTALTKAGVLP